MAVILEVWRSVSDIRVPFEVNHIGVYVVLLFFYHFHEGTDRTFMHLVSVQRVCGSTPLNLTHALWSTLWSSVAMTTIDTPRYFL